MRHILTLTFIQKSKAWQQPKFSRNVRLMDASISTWAKGNTFPPTKKLMTSKALLTCLKSRIFKVVKLNQKSQTKFNYHHECSSVGKFIFASLVVTFRHGREEDEMMGVSFKKELVVDRVQVHPAGKDDSRTKLQVT